MDRNKIIVKTSIIGIVMNIVLVIFKMTIGLIVHSVAIVLDSINNLSDVLSSVINIVGTKLANKAPDKEHPYGHGRIEYVTSFIISAIVLFAGIIAAKESIVKIINPVQPEYSVIALFIIVVAVIVKLLYGVYAKKVGEKVNSQSLLASGQDAYMDAVLSSSTFIAGILNIFLKLNIEGWLGAVISVIIIRSAVQMLKGTIDLMLGSRLDSELTQKLKEIISSFDEVQGVYDLNVHEYGPEKMVGSVHIQVRNDMTAEEIHILTRKIEYKVYSKFRNSAYNWYLLSI